MQSNTDPSIGIRVVLLLRKRSCAPRLLIAATAAWTTGQEDRPRDRAECRQPRPQQSLQVMQDILSRLQMSEGRPVLLLPALCLPYPAAHVQLGSHGALTCASRGSRLQSTGRVGPGPPRPSPSSAPTSVGPSCDL